MLSFEKLKFVVSMETRCPAYRRGDCFSVYGHLMEDDRETVTTCLLLATQLQSITNSLREKKAFRKGPSLFSCPGCVGLMRFEPKSAQKAMTTQMKLLLAADHRSENSSVFEMIEILEEIDFFRTMPNEEIVKIANLLSVRAFTRGQALIEEDRLSDGLFILLSGDVNAVSSSSGTAIPLHPGDLFGEVSLLSGSPAIATVLAATDVKVAFLGRDDFNTALRKHESLRAFLYRLIVERLRATSKTTAISKDSDGLSGTTNDLSTADLFQLLHGSAKTGQIQLDGDIEWGVLSFVNGEVVSANYMDLIDGVDAFQRIFCISDANFIFSSGLDLRFQTLPPIGPFMSMIMTASKELDDAVGRRL